MGHPAVAASWLLATAAPALAHGAIGGRTDLPVPLWLFVFGAITALIVSFVALDPLDRAAVRGSPREDRPTVVHPVDPDQPSARVDDPDRDAPVLPGGRDGVGPPGCRHGDDRARRRLRLVLGGPRDRARPVRQPVATLAVRHDRTARRVRRRGSQAVPRVVGQMAGGGPPVRLRVGGARPAVLRDARVPRDPDRHLPADPDRRDAALRSQGLAGERRGVRRVPRADRGDRAVHAGPRGRVVTRPFLAGLARVEPRPGLLAAIMVALGSTTFDGFSRTTLCITSTASFGVRPDARLHRGVAQRDRAGDPGLRARDAGRRAGGRRRWHPLAVRFAHSLVPIMLAYVVAHYFSFLVLEGQLGLSASPTRSGSAGTSSVRATGSSTSRSSRRPRSGTSRSRRS